MDHYLQVVSYDGSDPSLRLMCTAPPDAMCRRRPVDPYLESWTDEDENEMTTGHECWAVEWIEEDGWESVATETDGILFSIGVQVYYDEGPVIAAVENADTDDISAKEVEAAAEAIYATATAGATGKIPPTCDLGTYWTDLARAALVAARKVSE